MADAHQLSNTIVGLIEAASRFDNLGSASEDIGAELARVVPFDRLSIMLPDPNPDLAVPTRIAA